MASAAWHVCFWLGGLALVWCFAGYAITLAILTRGRRQVSPWGSVPAKQDVSIVIAARNEGPRIAKKISDLTACDTSRVCEIILVCDHCTDDTAEQALATSSALVRVHRHEAGPSGKAGALNAGVALAAGELVLFTDARQRIAPDAVSRLAAWFDDPANGAVSGSLEIEPSQDGTGSALDAYWRLEKQIRECESAIDSSIGCTGAIYMIRRSLFRPLPADTILDDVVIPMNIVMQGFRVRFDSEARAYDPQTLDGAAESRRKIRTLAGNFQMLFRHPQWLLPWVNRLWWQLISHKYLRIAAPLLLVGCFIASWRLGSNPFYGLAFGCQITLWVLAATGLMIPRVRWRALSIPAGFLFLQISVVRGFFFWLASLAKPQGAWK